MTRRKIHYQSSGRVADKKSLRLSPKGLTFDSDWRERLQPRSTSPRAVIKGIIGGGSIDEFGLKSTGLLQIAEEFVRRRKRIHVKSLMERFFPSHQVPAQSSQFEDVDVVAAFCQHVIGLWLPAGLLGMKNFAVVSQLMTTLMKFRHFDTIDGELIESRVRVKDCRWLKYLTSSDQQRELLRYTIMWVIRLWYRLVRSFFYVTDQQVGGYHLFYYRKSFWSRLVKENIPTVISSLKLSRVSQRQLGSMVRSAETYGPLQLRYIPKKVGIRPIIWSAKPRQKLIDSLAISPPKLFTMNQLLRPLLAIIRAAAAIRPEVAGCAVRGTSMIRSRWLKYTSVAAFSADSQGLRFMVKADLVNCFSSISQTKLLNCLEKLGESLEKVGLSRFIVQKFLEMRWVRGTNRPTPKTLAWPAKLGVKCDLQPIGTQSYLDWSEAVEMLKPFIFQNTLKVGNCYYHQSAGIPQGSPVSTSLCDLYYGHLEKDTFNLGREDLLMRYVDDYLLISNSFDTAANFARTILRGIPDYQLQAKADKMAVNFNHPELRRWHLSVINDDSINWCGVNLQLRAPPHDKRDCGGNEQFNHYNTDDHRIAGVEQSNRTRL